MEISISFCFSLFLLTTIAHHTQLSTILKVIKNTQSMSAGTDSFTEYQNTQIPKIFNENLKMPEYLILLGVRYLTLRGGGGKKCNYLKKK